MHCSLSEVGESTVGDLAIGVDRQNTSSMICFISNEVTANEVERRLGKRYDC